MRSRGARDYSPAPAAAARLRAELSRSITARQPGLTLARCLCMQAVIRCTLGISWPHSRMASPLHICCASDASAGAVLAEKAVAAKAMAEKSATLLVRRKFIDAFPKVAARCWPLFVRGRCTRLAMPHASPITRESPGVVARILPMFESKVLRRPASNYAPMIRSCNGLLQHFFDCCVLATPIVASDPDPARLGCRARRRVFRAAKLSRNAEVSGSRTTSR